jgi:thioredoxin reductase (NADPH)
VENYPGVPEGGIEGSLLAARFLARMKSLGIEPRMEAVSGWTREGDLFAATTERAVVRARALVLATGTKPKRAVLETTGSRGRDRISSDFLEIRSRKPSSVIIIGGGDAAFDYALSLAGSGWNVTIAFRRDRPSALGLLVERVSARGDITVHARFQPGRARAGANGVVLDGLKGGEACSLRAACLLLALGRDPEKDLLGSRPLPENLTGAVDGEPGLFAAGDVRRSLSRQTVIAAGDGMASAMAAAAFLGR